MNDDFPFQSVYDFFAHRFVTHGLPPDGLSVTFMCMVMVHGDKVVRTEMLPLPKRIVEDGPGVLFEIAEDLMREMAASDPVPPFCLIIGLEALTLASRVEKGAPRPAAMTAEEIATDENTRSSVVLMVHRPGVQRMGVLPVDEDRQIAYAPMLPPDGTLATSEQYAAHVRAGMH